MGSFLGTLWPRDRAGEADCAGPKIRHDLGRLLMLPDMPTVAEVDSTLPGTLALGAFSFSLNVADLAVSREFYAKLGFEEVGGDPDHGYVIIKNGEALLGLFQNICDSNILTFNPGLTGRLERVEQFTDIREIQAHLADTGIQVQTPIAEEAGDSGAAHLILVDPDGNVIMVDQFF